MRLNAFVVAAISSGSGKSTITLGLIAALKSMGYRVQPFKVGPDFIDTGLHSLVAERPSRNLDPWMCGSDYVKRLFARCLNGVDVAVIEGVMGVLDGGESSTASVAALLDVPVVLVVDVKSSAESAVLPVRGFMEIEKNLRVAGVILNRVASKRHLELVVNAINKHCGVPVIGYLMKDDEIKMPQRHLGLYTAEDGWLTGDFTQALTKRINQHVDVARLLKHTVVEIDYKQYDGLQEEKKKCCRIAVARDRAFCFYYEDNLEMLVSEGAEIVFFSPLEDSTLPEADALYIGGGYPELNASELAENRSLLNEIRAFSERGGPIYAECGGFMYLTEGIEIEDGTFFPMSGVYPLRTKFRRGRMSLGYREIILKKDAILGKKGSVMRGHEFHYSELKEHDNKAQNIYAGGQGFLLNNTLASYVHIHFASNPEIPAHMIKTILHHRASK